MREKFFFSTTILCCLLLGSFVTVAAQEATSPAPSPAPLPAPSPDAPDASAPSPDAPDASDLPDDSDPPPDLPDDSDPPPDAPDASDFYPLLDPRINQCKDLYGSVCQSELVQMKRDREKYDEDRDPRVIIGKKFIDDFLTKEFESPSDDLIIAQKMYKACVTYVLKTYKKFLKKENSESVMGSKFRARREDGVQNSDEDATYSEEKDFKEDLENSKIFQDHLVLNRWYKELNRIIGNFPSSSGVCNSTLFEFDEAFTMITLFGGHPLLKLERDGFGIGAPLVVKPGELTMGTPAFYDEQNFPSQVLAYRKFIRFLIVFYRHQILGWNIPFREVDLQHQIDLIFGFEKKLAKVYLKFDGMGTAEKTFPQWEEDWSDNIKCQSELKLNWDKIVLNLMPKELKVLHQSMVIKLPVVDYDGKTQHLHSEVANVLDMDDKYIIADYFSITLMIQLGRLFYPQVRDYYKTFLIALGKDLPPVETECALNIAQIMPATFKKAWEASNEDKIKKYNRLNKLIFGDIRTYMVETLFAVEEDHEDANTYDGIKDKINATEFYDIEDYTSLAADLKEYYEYYMPTDMKLTNVKDYPYHLLLLIFQFSFVQREISNHRKIDPATPDQPKPVIENRKIDFDSMLPKVVIFEGITDETQKIAVTYGVNIVATPLTDLDDLSPAGYIAIIGKQIAEVILKKYVHIVSEKCDEHDQDDEECYEGVFRHIFSKLRLIQDNAKMMTREMLSEKVELEITYGTLLNKIQIDGPKEVREAKKNFFYFYAKQMCPIYKSTISPSQSVAAGEFLPKTKIEYIEENSEDFRKLHNCPNE